MKQPSIFITGATSGIGRSIAAELAADGHGIGFNGLGSESEIAACCAQFRDNGASLVQYYDADMRDAAAVRAMLARAEQELGGIAGLVNNAGIQHVAAVEDFPADAWDSVIAINLSAAFHSIAAVLPAMRQRNTGRIINIASVHGLVASANKSAYTAAKHGLVGLTRSVALEIAETAITCNAICPGWVRTPLVEAQINRLAEQRGLDTEAASRALLQEKQPSGRFVDAAMIAAMIRFLLTPAADAVNGAVLTMDGGWTAQ